MRHMTALLVVAGILLNCGSESVAPRAAGLAIVDLKGQAEAFENRTIFVEDVQAPEAGRTMDDEYPVGVSVGVCTRDMRILHGDPIRIRVYEAGTLLAESLLELVACRYAEQPGNVEKASLILERDGSVVTALGEDPRISSTCIKMPVVCE